MLSKFSVDEEFMHHFEKMQWRLCPETPHWGSTTGLLRTSVLQTPHCPPLKKILLAPMLTKTLESAEFLQGGCGALIIRSPEPDPDPKSG